MAQYCCKWSARANGENHENPSKNEGTPRGGDRGNVSQLGPTFTVCPCGLRNLIPVAHRPHCGPTYSQAQVDDMISCAQRAERRRCASEVLIRCQHDPALSNAIMDAIYAPAAPATPSATTEQEKGSTLKG